MRRLVFSLLVLAILVVVSSSGYAALTWDIQTVDSSTTYTSLALDSAGNPHISCLAGSFSTYHLKYASWNGISWGAQVVDSAGWVGWATSLALDSAGNPRISYYDYDNKNLKYASKTGSVWDSQTVDTSNVSESYTSLALDSAGNPRISYIDETNHNLKYASWNGSVWDIQTVDTSNVSESYTSLALDSAGNPRISYQAGGRGHLKYASWNGTNWDIQTVDSGYLDRTISLALDNNEHPKISYYNLSTIGTGRGLKYASWNGTNWDISKITNEPGSTVIHAVSLALDSAGNPRISYIDDNLNLNFVSSSGESLEPPEANAGDDQVGDEGSPITFDASGSSDSDGTIVLYEWDFDNDAEYDDGTGETADWTFTDNGTYTVGLRVTDDDDLTDTDTAEVTVSNVDPTAEAGDDQTVNEGDLVSFNGSFTDPGSDDTHTIEWDFGDGGTATGTLTPTHTYVNNGVYTVTLTVTDDDGGVGTDTLTVNVSVMGNTSPVADADGPYSLTWGNDFILDASGSYDPDLGDYIVSYEWDLDDDDIFELFVADPVYTLLAADYQPIFGSPGIFDINLRVTDTFTDFDVASTSVTFTTSAGHIPEPSTLVLFGLGFLGLVGVIIRQRRKGK